MLWERDGRYVCFLKCQLLKSHASHIPKTHKSIKRTIRALENLRIGAGKHESQVGDLITSDKIKDIPFNISSKFFALPRNVLLENIIQYIILRLLPDKNKDESIVNFNCIDVLEPSLGLMKK
jgi:hypothetical protein